MPRHVPPPRQQRHASGVSALLSGNGSLKRSKTTRSLPLNAVPSKMPQPFAQAYSAPERFTPRSRTGCPRESTSRVPCTCTVGAPDDGGGGGGGAGGGVPPLVEAAGLLRHPASVLKVSKTTRRMGTARMLWGERCPLKRAGPLR